MFNIFIWFKEISKHHQLIFSLISKQIKVKYKHPVLGFLWALLIPLLLSLVFMVVFSRIIKIPISNYPFFIFLITALFPWNFLSLSVSEATMSILEGGELIKKVYFPREIIPISIVLTNLINFIFTCVVIIFFLIIFRIKITILLLFLPLIILLQTFLISGIVLMVSCLQVRYRDIKYAIEVLLLLWFYLTPIFYPINLVANISERFLRFYLLNPLTELVTLYRFVFLPDYIYQIPATISIYHLIFVCIFLCVGIFYLGLLVFRKYAPDFADYI